MTTDGETGDCNWHHKAVEFGAAIRYKGNSGGSCFMFAGTATVTSCIILVILVKRERERFQGSYTDI